MLPRFRRGFLLAAILTAGLLVLSCGGGEEASKTPAATQPAGAQTPSAEKVPGVTDTEIILGTHFPSARRRRRPTRPSPTACGPTSTYVNSQGGVYGRKIKFMVGDDHYNPADAVEVVRKLVEQDDIFAMVCGLGDATHAAVWKYLEEKRRP